jgi:hypothetical protein
LSAPEHFVQILERQLGKDAPQVVEAGEKLFKLAQLATGVGLNGGTSIGILSTIWIFLTPQTA